MVTADSIKLVEKVMDYIKANIWSLRVPVSPAREKESREDQEY